MRIAVVRGTQDSLHEMGMQSLVGGAHLLLQIPGDNGKVVCNEWGETYEVVYVEVDAPEQVLAQSMSQIKSAWENAHPDEAHLGHAAQGMWWSYWISPQMRSIADLLMDGDSNGLRAAAADFIEAGFGEKRGPSIDDDVEERDWIAEIPGSSLART